MAANRFTHLAIFGAEDDRKLHAIVTKALKGTRFEQAEVSKDPSNYTFLEINFLQNISTQDMFRARLSNNIAVTVTGGVPSAKGEFDFAQAPSLQFADAIVWFDGKSFWYKGETVALVWVLAQLRP